MADQIVITEKSSQAKDVRAAVGFRYGDILAAEGHLFDLLEPEHNIPSMTNGARLVALSVGPSRRPKVIESPCSNKGDFS